MGQDPRTIRQDIEETREQMGETVEALAYKTDVKGRARKSVSGKVESMKHKITGTAGSVSDATPSTEEVKQSAQRVVGIAEENPLGLAIGALAVGFLAGMAAPTTRVENQKIGPLADQVKDQAKETAQVAMEHGKEAAQEAAQAAVEAGKSHAQEARSDLQGDAQGDKERIGSS